ncbi:MAG TPA: cyclic nucleotide-binding domain-containing protein [Bauldia sp.]|nr:cyclic nucleotide-binding domain-containing protein [Bauldia sp.]
MDAREVIAANPFFAEVLGDTEIDMLAGRALKRDYGHGLELVREDDSGSSLFIVVSGQVDVIAGGQGGKRIARLGPGAVVGEMSLMTGARRSATVIAATDVTVLEVTKAALAPVFEASPELIGRFAAVLRKRQGELDRAFGSGGLGIMGERGFGDLIRGFFGGGL